MTYTQDTTIGALNPILAADIDLANDQFTIWDSSAAAGSRTKRTAIEPLLARTISLLSTNSVPWSSVNKTGAVAADVGAVALGAPQLTDARVPTDASVTTAKLAPSLSVPWANVNKTGAVPGDVGAAPVSHGHAIGNVTGLQDALDARQLLNARLTALANAANPSSVKIPQIGTDGFLTLVDPPSGGSSTPTWTVASDDNFTRANGAVGNNWTNLAASGTAAISSNRLVLTRGSGFTPLLVRPANENLLNQEIELIWTGSASHGAAVFARVQAANSFYVAEVTFTTSSFAGNITVRRCVSGAFTSLGTIPISPAMVAGTEYSLKIRATGSSPTTINVELKNNTTQAIIGTGNFTDSQSVLQSVGQVGICHADDPSGTLNRAIHRTLASSGSITTAQITESGGKFFIDAAKAGTGISINASTGVITATGSGGSGSAGIPGTINVADSPYNVSPANTAANNTTGLQAAINAAIAAGGTRTVFIPPTNAPIQINNTINIDGSVTIFGAGYHSCIHQVGVGGTAVEQPNIFVIRASDVTIHNLRLRGNNTAFPAAGFVNDDISHGIYCNLNTVRNVYIDQVWCHNLYYGGIKINALGDVRITNCFCWQNMTGWEATNNGGAVGSYDISVSHPRSPSELPGSRFLISNNFCLSMTDIGIGINGDLLDDVVCTNNVIFALAPDFSVPTTAQMGTPTFPRRRHGLMVQYATGTTNSVDRRFIVANNYIRNTSWTGLNINGIPGGSTTESKSGPAIVTGNIFSQCARVSSVGQSRIRGGLYMSTGYQSYVISGNVFQEFENGHPGINVNSQADPLDGTAKGGALLISNNQFVEMPAGIEVRSFATKEIEINGNVFKATVENDISINTQVTDSQIRIINNRIIRSSNAHAAISFGTSYVANGSTAIIQGNEIRGEDATTNADTNSAMRLQKGHRYVISDNVIERFYFGIFFTEDYGSRQQYPKISDNFFDTVFTAVRCNSSSGNRILVEGSACHNVTNRTAGTGVAEGVRFGNTYEVLLSAQPTNGSWVVGDRWRASAPASTGTYEGICITAGTPGTWRNLS